MMMKLRLNAVAFAAAALVLGQGAWAGEAEAKKWIDSEFQPSTLNKDQQMAEMKWFIEAAKKLQAKGVKEVSVVSETITTHEYESKTLARAFEEITGIKVKHDLIQEGRPSRATAQARRGYRHQRQDDHRRAHPAPAERWGLLGEHRHAGRVRRTRRAGGLDSGHAYHAGADRSSGDIGCAGGAWGGSRDDGGLLA
jgi:hypothetical protein